MRVAGASAQKTLTWVYRRVMLEKTKDRDPTAVDFRPIDIYSTLLRTYTSAQANLLAQWKKDITHPTQYASHGGTLPALSRLALIADRGLRKQGPVFGLSIDFCKLYNTIAPMVAIQAAIHAGLHQETARELLVPLCDVAGVYRLPFNHVCPFFVKTRGLAQGLSTSVLLAEVFVGMLIWKLSHLDQLESITYIDDVNLVTTSAETKSLRGRA